MGISGEVSGLLMLMGNVDETHHRSDYARQSSPGGEGGWSAPPVLARPCNRGWSAPSVLARPCDRVRPGAGQHLRCLLAQAGQHLRCLLAHATVSQPPIGQETLPVGGYCAAGLLCSCRSSSADWHCRQEGCFRRSGAGWFPVLLPNNCCSYMLLQSSQSHHNRHT